MGITGATGAVYGVRLLARAHKLGFETQLVTTPSDVLNAHHELGLDRSGLQALADHAYVPGDIGACLISGSFDSAAPVIASCTVETLAAIANGLSDNLLTRAADVVLKMRRRRLLMVRRTPFNLAPLRNMAVVTAMGAIAFPPLPAFHHRPASIDGLVAESVERVMSLVGSLGAVWRPWAGLRSQPSQGFRFANTAFGYSGLPRLPL